MMTDSSIGDALRAVRERKGFSQDAIARSAGTQSGYISRIELGNVKSPGIEVLARICRSLGITVDELLVEAGISHPTSSDKKGAHDTQEPPEWAARILDEISRLRSDLAAVLPESSARVVPTGRFRVSEAIAETDRQLSEEYQERSRDVGSEQDRGQSIA